jgi:hypothetical protein
MSLGSGFSTTAQNYIDEIGNINVSGGVSRSWLFSGIGDSMVYKFVIILGLALGLAGPALSAQSPVVSVSTSPAYITPVAISSYPVTSSDSWRTVPNHAFREGELLEYVIKWGIVTGGHSSLNVKGIEKLGDRMAYHIVTEAQSIGIVSTFYKTHDRNETWLDVPSLITLRYEKHIHEGKYRVEAAIDFDQVNHQYYDYSNRLDKGTTEYAQGPIPPYVMDVLGSMYYIRTQPLSVGQTFVIDVYDGKKIWPLIVKVEKKEKIKVAAGKFECFRVEPTLREPGVFISKGKKLQVWMTTDTPHMPVLMRSEIFIGHVAAELVKYRLDSTSPTPPPTTPQ